MSETQPQTEPDTPDENDEPERYQPPDTAEPVPEQPPREDSDDDGDPA